MGDILIEIDGRTNRMNEADFLVYIYGGINRRARCCRLLPYAKASDWNSNCRCVRTVLFCQVRLVRLQRDAVPARSLIESFVRPP